MGSDHRFFIHELDALSNVSTFVTKDQLPPNSESIKQSVKKPRGGNKGTRWSEKVRCPDSDPGFQKSKKHGLGGATR